MLGMSRPKPTTNDFMVSLTIDECTHISEHGIAEAWNNEVCMERGRISFDWDFTDAAKIFRSVVWNDDITNGVCDLTHLYQCGFL